MPRQSEFMLYYCEFVLGSKPKSFEKRRIFQASEQCCVATERGRGAWFFFHLAASPPPPHSVSSLPCPISLQSFTRQRASAAAKSRMNFHSSSYLRQTISICTALFSLMANWRAASCCGSSISILLWRVHPLALHLIAVSAWPRNQGEGSTSSTASHLSSSTEGAAALAHWLLGNVPALLCAIDQV